MWDADTRAVSNYADETYNEAHLRKRAVGHGAEKIRAAGVRGEQESDGAETSQCIVRRVLNPDSLVVYLDAPGRGFS